ncbi:MAG: N(G),N(G)-dimethylarginine dimethylaminohydrolase [Actinomycetales bacterium]|nr:N(G),N(G)-dimethylarginine dimethylaminohydrolase [Actinomycetales bacterium]
MPHNLAVVRRPGPRLADGLVTHLEKSDVSYEKALEQWQGYVDALAAAGWDIALMPPADDCPDAVFVEDVLIVHDDLAVVTSPGAPERRPEIEGVAEFAESLGLQVGRIELPGTLDGGDVLRVITPELTTMYVGSTARTNGRGIDQLAELMRPKGVRVQMVPVERALHLKSAVTALPDGTVIGWDPVVDDKDAFPRYEGMPEEGGAHVIRIGEDHLLMAASAPRTAALLRERGYTVTAVDISEFEKLEGCVTCLSVRIR